MLAGCPLSTNLLEEIMSRFDGIEFKVMELFSLLGRKGSTELQDRDLVHIWVSL